MKRCVLCSKGHNIANNRSKALNATKKKQRPNLQKKRGIGWVCTNCIKSMGK